jgi:hypothetical protein
LIERITLPSLQEQPRSEKFTKLSTAERICCVARIERSFDQRLGKYLCAEPDAIIAGWRRSIVAAGGIAASGEPLLRRLMSRLHIEDDRQPRRRNYKGGGHTADLHSLLAAASAVHARRELQIRSGTDRYRSSAMSSLSSSAALSSPASPKAPSTPASN